MASGYMGRVILLAREPSRDGNTRKRAMLLSNFCPRMRSHQCRCRASNFDRNWQRSGLICSDSRAPGKGCFNKDLLTRLMTKHCHNCGDSHKFYCNRVAIRI